MGALAVLLATCAAQARDLRLDCPAQVFFSPKGGCTEAIEALLDQAAVSVYVQAFGFTAPRIREALIRAQKRGVQVLALVDKSNRENPRSIAPALREAGVEVLVDDQHAIAHNKLMLVDGRTVLTGSFNFTASAEKDFAENVLILHSPELAAIYLENFRAHLEHSARK
ncbi:phospholipase D family protein [Fundidesulfovibrio soli]|uniref:phospholipase D family nuclease n=1 Tax=Fundidesulfovibrio soli TaxID=2922716 RepID=UPI001FAFA2C0|nr:phospholipase D family protein [Fundidesulfovibrio soli]